MDAACAHRPDAEGNRVTAFLIGAVIVAVLGIIVIGSAS
jgi:hypothetical protein